MKRMKDIIILFLVVILSACGISAKSWQDHYDLGMRYLSEGNYEEAILSFTAAIEIDAKRIEAFIGRGDAYFAFEELEDHLDKAISDFKMAIDIDKTYTDAYLKLADVYYAQNDLEKEFEILCALYEINETQEILSKIENYKEQLEEEKGEKEKLSAEGDIEEGYWFDTVHGGTFYVPAGFENIDVGPSPGYVYWYKNDSLGMSVTITEIAFAKIGIGMEPQELVLNDYQNQLDYLGSKVTYNIARDNYCVWSGYYEDGSIFYNKYINVDDNVYVSVSIEYPEENKEVCDIILTDFLNDFKY